MADLKYVKSEIEKIKFIFYMKEFFFVNLEERNIPDSTKIPKINLFLNSRNVFFFSLVFVLKTFIFKFKKKISYVISSEFSFKHKRKFFIFYKNSQQIQNNL